PGRMLLLEVSFNVDRSADDFEWPGVKAELLPLYPDASQYELMVNVTLYPQGMTADFLYHTDLFDRATIARWGGYFERLIGALVDNPGARPSQVSLLTAAEEPALVRGGLGEAR